MNHQPEIVGTELKNKMIMEPAGSSLFMVPCDAPFNSINHYHRIGKNITVNNRRNIEKYRLNILAKREWFCKLHTATNTKYTFNDTTKKRFNFSYYIRRAGGLYCHGKLCLSLLTISSGFFMPITHLKSSDL